MMGKNEVVKTDATPAFQNQVFCYNSNVRIRREERDLSALKIPGILPREKNQQQKETSVFHNAVMKFSTMK